MVVAGENSASLVYSRQRLKAAEPWVARATARRLSDIAQRKPTKRPLALLKSSAIPEPRPTRIKLFSATPFQKSYEPMRRFAHSPFRHQGLPIKL
jgi:hypothetical protein